TGGRMGAERREVPRGQDRRAELVRDDGRGRDGERLDGVVLANAGECLRDLRYLLRLRQQAAEAAVERRHELPLSYAPPGERGGLLRALQGESGAAARLPLAVAEPVRLPEAGVDQDEHRNPFARALQLTRDLD